MLSLNAWFERAAPYLELRNNYTNKVLISLNGERLYEFLQDCGLIYSDLLDSAKSSEIIKILLLASIKDCSVSEKLLHSDPDKILHFPSIKKAKKCVRNFNNEVCYDNVIPIDKFKMV